MKKTIMVLLVAAGFFTACNSKQDIGSTTVPMQNPFYNPLYDDGSDYSFAQRIMMESPQYIAWRKQKIEDDRLFNDQLEAKAEVPKTTNPVSRTTAKKSTVKSTAKNNNQNTSTAQQPATKRKGWSNAAKGTVIGAGSGAVVGVIVSKNKVKGGIIGGLLGAGVGYVIGNEKDKKKRTN